MTLAGSARQDWWPDVEIVAGIAIGSLPSAVRIVEKNRPIFVRPLAAMRQFREQHMTAWLDDSIPALDGLTPRHAATLPRMRRLLDVLLKEIEQSEARLPAGEQIDIHRLRVALGLTVAPDE